MFADQICDLFRPKIRKAANETARAEKELLKPADSTRLKLQREIPQNRPPKGQTQKPWKTTLGQGKVTHTHTLKYGRMIFFGRKAKLNTVS